MKHEIQTKFVWTVTLDRSAFSTPGGTKGRALLLDFYLWGSHAKASSYSRVIMVGGYLPDLPCPVRFPEKG